MAQDAAQGERAQLPPEDTELGRALRKAHEARAAAEASAEHVEYLWPENRTAWRCWQELQTQWRVGVAGATGLDYAGVAAYLDEEQRARRLRRRERAGVWTSLRAAETAVLAVWGEQRRKRELQKS